VSAAREACRLIAGPQVVDVRLILNDARAADALEQRPRVIGRGVVNDDDFVRPDVALQDRLETLKGQLGAVVEDEDDADLGPLVLWKFNDRVGEQKVAEVCLGRRGE
jgi:hypothetical protein